MDEELAIIQSAKDKIAIQNRKKDVAILKQTLEPIEEAISELKETIQEGIDLEKKEKPKLEYFDKDFNTKLSTSIEKLFSLIQKFKQPDITVDLSPVNNIATEIKRGQDSIIQLLNKPNQSEHFQKLIIAMVDKQNSFLDREFKQPDISKELSSISQSISSKPNQRVEKLTVVYEQGGMIKEVIPIYKK